MFSWLRDRRTLISRIDVSGKPQSPAPPPPLTLAAPAATPPPPGSILIFFRATTSPVALSRAL